MLIFRGVYLLTFGFCWRDFWGYLGSWYSRLSCWCNAHCGRLFLATVQYCTGYLCTMRKCCHAWWKKWMSNCTCVAASVPDPWTYIFPIRFTCKMSNEKGDILPFVIGFPLSHYRRKGFFSWLKWHLPHRSTWRPRFPQVWRWHPVFDRNHPLDCVCRSSRNSPPLAWLGFA